MYLCMYLLLCGTKVLLQMVKYTLDKVYSLFPSCSESCQFSHGSHRHWDHFCRGRRGSAKQRYDCAVDAFLL